MILKVENIDKAFGKNKVLKGCFLRNGFLFNVRNCR